MAIDPRIARRMQADLQGEVRDGVEGAKEALEDFQAALRQATQAARAEQQKRFGAMLRGEDPDRKARDEALAKERAAAAAMGQEVQGGLSQAMGALKGGLGGAGKMIGGEIGAAIAGPAGAAVGGQLTDVLSAPLTAFRDNLLAVRAAFDQVVNTVKPFVQAFAPSTVQSFDLAMRDLNATVGMALVPVMQACTQAVRTFADALLPAMRQLEPVVREVTDVINRFLQPVLLNWGGQLQGLAAMASGLLDVIRPLIPIWEAVFDAWRTFSAVFQGVVAQLVSNLGDFLRSVMQLSGLGGKYQTLGDALRALSLEVIRATAMFAKMLKANAFLDQMRRAFGADVSRGASTGMAAATNAQVTTVPDWARNLAVAAATASGTAGMSAEDKFRDDVVKALTRIESGEDAIGKAVGAAATAATEWAKRELAALIGSAVRDAIGQTPLGQALNLRDQIMSRLRAGRQEG